MPAEGLELIVEKLAAKVHQAWVDHRQAGGWSYGEHRNDLLKQSPFMTEYEALPEIEKETDRKTVRTVVGGLQELGCTLTLIRRDGVVAEPPSPLIEEIRQRLAAKNLVTLDSLTATWKLCLTLRDCPADIYFDLGKRLLKLGEPILAYDVLFRGREILEGASANSQTARDLLVRLKQQLALSLAQCGAAERARTHLIQLCDEGHDTPETLGLLGRVCKDLALKTPDQPKRLEWLEMAFQSYRRGFDKGDASYRESNESKSADDAYYCGINAAAISVLCGNQPRAKALAGRIKEICQAQEDQSGPDYWLLATLGEAELILGDFHSAALWYGQAVEIAIREGDWRGLAATRKQARLLSSALGSVEFDLNSVFPRTSVVVFASAPSTGHAIAREDGSARLRETFDKRLRETGAIAGYFGGMSPEDLLLGEALLDSGRVAHLVLPYSRVLCRLSFSESWRESFDRIISRATSVTDDAQRSPRNDQVNMRFAALRAYGSAWLRAQRLDSNLLLWGMESATAGVSDKRSGFLSQHWENLGAKWEAFAATPNRADLLPGEPAPTSGSGESEPPPLYDIRAMLFADVRGYSRLDDPGLFRFAQVFMSRVAQLLDTFASRILSRRTAGDGIFLVFSDIGAAAEIAFALRNLVAQTDWESLGLPSRLGIRISLDAGPVYLFEDPVVHRPEVCGAFVNRAARVEPVTPPNEVYASETFSALYVAGGARRFRFDYVGQTELPKGFGLTPLYCLAEAEA